MCEALRELMKEEIEEELKKSRDQAIKEGREEGREEGRLEQLMDLVAANLLPIETAVQCSGLSPKEFQAAMNARKG